MKALRSRAFLFLLLSSGIALQIVVIFDFSWHYFLNFLSAIYLFLVALLIAND